MRLRSGKSRRLNAADGCVIVFVSDGLSGKTRQGRLKMFQPLFAAFAAGVFRTVVTDGQVAQMFHGVAYFGLIRRIAEGVLFDIEGIFALHGFHPGVFGFAGLGVAFANQLP